MSDFLQSMASSSRERAAAVSPAFTSADFDKPVVRLQLNAFDVIAEIKQRSPAEGDLSGGRHCHSNSSHGASALVSRARVYAAGGAAAISVLTEPSRFDGDLAHLEAVAAAAPNTPVMRKDFLVDPVQIAEARKAGASGVLLIATMLTDAELRQMLDRAWECGLFVLLESFDADDLHRSSALLDNAIDGDKAGSGQLLFGVNTRNLRTLAVDAGRLTALSTALPAARCVAESGLSTADDAARVAALGYQVALVGTALMRSDDPATLIGAMREAGVRS